MELTERKSSFLWHVLGQSGTNFLVPLCPKVNTEAKTKISVTYKKVCIGTTYSNAG